MPPIPASPAASSRNIPSGSLSPRRSASGSGSSRPLCWPDAASWPWRWQRRSRRPDRPGGASSVAPPAA
jgi:hypothetical protein